MSSHQSITRTSVTDLIARKAGDPIVSLTAYSAPMARILDEHVDLLLVGDSLGMVLYGMDSTLGVTVDMMINHGKAVVSHSSRAMVLVDMPFGSYQASPEQAFKNASRIMSRTGCQAVKLEGGREMVPTVKFLTERGIPVMAHIGLKPQHVHSMGGYKYQGRTEGDKSTILTEAKAHETAGAFALLLEGIDQQLASDITHNVAIPTIGIGASVECDGQVLVTEDMLGLMENTPKFVQEFGMLRSDIDNAVKAYSNAVRDKSFPSDAHCFGKKNS